MARRHSPEASNQAQAAACIRKELKAAFPSVAFRVTSKGYSGGDSVRVEWTDGPTAAQVEKIAGQYQMGSFDGMQDLYEYTNRRRDIPQSRWVHEDRDISRAAMQAAIDLVNRRFGWSLAIHPEWDSVDQATDVYDNGGRRSDWVRRTLNDLSMLCASCGAATLPGDAYCPMCGASLAEKEEEPESITWSDMLGPLPEPDADGLVRLR